MKKTFLISVAMMFALVFNGNALADSGQKIEKGKRVSIEYRLRLADGTVVDSNVNKEPLIYIQGSGQIIPGLERQMEGLRSGEAKKIEVSPKEAYGETNPKLIVEVPKSTIDVPELNVGMSLYTPDGRGGIVAAIVKEIKKDKVVVDMNHPLAGKTLYFDIKILKVE